MGARDVDIAIHGGGANLPGDSCGGPDAEGNCRRVSPDGRVVCAGRHLRVARGLPIEAWEIVVADDAAGCPLAWLMTRLVGGP